MAARKGGFAHTMAAPDQAPALLPEGTTWWSIDEAALEAALESTSDGLRGAEAAARLQRCGSNELRTSAPAGWGRLATRQLTSPLVLILLVGAAVSLFVGDWTDAATIAAILLGSTALGVAQEHRANHAMARLRGRLALNARVWRDGVLQTLPARELVPGDVIELSAGNLVPADGRVIAARDFLLVESSLTGESFPVEKSPGRAEAGAPLPKRLNSVFLGSSVRSGTARVLVVRTGRSTEMGAVADRIAATTAPTEFERGVRRFGELLLRVMFLVVVAVLVFNQLLGRPQLDSLMFAVALAVGLSPELLPAIVAVTLSRGARRLAKAGVLVRRLAAIEDLGGIDVLCTDKTGTLTVGVMALGEAVDALGAPSPAVLRWAYVNAALETGIDNPLDAAIVAAGTARGLGVEGLTKIDEIPYDFRRRRLTIVVADPADGRRHRVVTKGAYANVLASCRAVDGGDGIEQPLDEAVRARLEDWVRAQGEKGVRVLAVATRTVEPRADYTVADEEGLLLAGFVCFSDPPKPTAVRAVRDLAARGIAVKIITGDNRHVAAHLARTVGLDGATLLTGEQIAGLRDEALWHLAARCSVFAEVDPAQKERIVRALQRGGHAVGYLGDGINDAPALHAADVGISVDQAVDVARESADVVLLEPDLDVLRRGVEQGRRSFANTLKYIQITTSANFGNMVSMALATPLLPFLPLTATQILLNNFLSDLPSLALANDRVDARQLDAPQRWDNDRVRRFMLVYGLTSSIFDLLTFWLLLAVFHATAAEFRSAWFVVSVVTELAVLLVLRTASPLWRSRPSGLLLASTFAVAGIALTLPYVPSVAGLLALVPLPATLMAAAAGIVLAYVAVTEGLKLTLARRAGGRTGRR